MARRTRSAVLWVALVALCGTPAQAFGKDAQGGGRSAPHTVRADSPDRFLQTNLHFERGETEISSIHYLRGGILKRCTRVTLGPLQKNRMTLIAGGVQYLYVFAGHTPRPYDAHIEELFGRSCDPGAVRRRSAIDRKGIEAGQALVGMTKEGVRLALGRPPEHATPSLDADTWIYWSSRFNKIAVVFQGGKVVQVRS